MRTATILAVLGLALFGRTAFAAGDLVPGPDQNTPGAKIYAEHCAQCHDHPVDRIPPRVLLSIVKTPEQVVTALTSGPMQAMGASLSADEKKQVATYITGKEPGASHDPDPAANRCTKPADPIQFGKGDWTQWGHDSGNTRYQADPGIAAADVPKLKVKWVFAYPGNIADSQPTIAGHMLFVANRAGRAFALDARTGCTYWSFDAEAGIHAGISVAKRPDGQAVAYVTTDNGYLHALDALTGKVIWTTRVEDHPATRLSGSPTFYDGRIYVPLSSLEEVSLFNASYACCTFRGGVVAVDVSTGKIAWKSHTITEEPKQIGVNADGTKLFGPSGVAVFSAPTIDPKRKAVYVGTGNSYTQESVPTANAVMAFDLDTGARRWVYQALADDNICPKAQKPEDCKTVGPDFDFAAPPVLRKLPNGKDVLVAISKADEIFGFDPDQNGKLLWRHKIGKGSRTAGVWGMSVDDLHMYVGSSDLRPGPDVVVGGLTAADFADGKTVWHTPAPPAVCAWGNVASALAAANGAVSCSPAQPGATALIPGVVFSGSVDGHMRAFSTKDGRKLWDVDTALTYKAINGATATGGSISNGAEAIANGTLFVNSGSAGVHQPGNALIAYTVDGK
ncbi:MAG TPA: PQQ-binding-like beta-propeller repeat protein [Alphaproteobacteria bacterium]|nr:PQQ-binding-like beta-propeller repeat protein [Alphaproteobacteria bacterium]